MEILKDSGALNNASKHKLSIFLYVLQCALLSESTQNRFSKKFSFAEKTRVFKNRDSEDLSSQTIVIFEISMEDDL